MCFVEYADGHLYLAKIRSPQIWDGAKMRTPTNFQITNALNSREIFISLGSVLGVHQAAGEGRVSQITLLLAGALVLELPRLTLVLPLVGYRY